MSQMMHECFDDEIAIDFPSVGNVVDRMRHAFLGERVDADVLRADVSLSHREAQEGHVVSLKVPVRITCPNCGGRGETWTEPCALCVGTGESLFHQALRVSVPPRVADGACVRFRLKSADAASIRVELRVAIRSSAA
ncbi:MAG: chaperone protein DnaJ [Acidobacteria bacterium]|nr:chaperone protein DnaJ [Acidobacteriota bacterium]